MKTLGVFLIASLFPVAGLAQNVAPPQQDTKTHVSTAQTDPASKQAAAAAQTQAAGASPTAKPPDDQQVVLDSVVAVINGAVILESDVEAERRFESLQMMPPGENTDARAAQHLITRTLILQQMKEQDQASAQISDADVAKLVDETKKELPGCLPTRCGTEAGWASFLAERGLTPDEVNARWKERLLILNYVNLRFRQGIRIPKATVQAYYDKNLVPQFEAKHEKAPLMKTLQPRIEEILLQQEVSKQMNDWETTLRQEGSVRILVPAYGESNANSSEEDDIPGGGA